jgi:hypothetical protein
MTPSPKDTQPTLDGQVARATFRDFVQEQVRQAIRATFIDILEEEISQFIGADRYERRPSRRDQRAGHRSRSIGTTAGIIDDLPVPRTRGGFHTQLFNHYQRRMPEVDGLIRDMFVGGVSQQQVGTVVEQLTGNAPSPSTVSWVFHSLESEFAQWQKRTLPKRYVYAFADGTYFSVIYEGIYTIDHAVAHRTSVITEQEQPALLAEYDSLPLARIKRLRECRHEYLLVCGRHKRCDLAGINRAEDSFQIGSPPLDSRLKLELYRRRNAERCPLEESSEVLHGLCSGKGAEDIRIAHDRHRIPCCTNRSASASISAALGLLSERCIIPRSWSASRISQRVTPASSAARPKLHASARYSSTASTIVARVGNVAAR